MSDIGEVLWQQFAIEVGEHLDLVERELGEEPEGDGKERVARLFRAFHSVKGLAAAMGVHAMEALAHTAEGVLGRVRDGAQPWDGRIADVILDAGYALRDMGEEALGTRRDVAARDDLLERLADAAARQAAGAAADGGAAPGRQAAEGPDERLLALAERLRATMTDLVAALVPGAGEDALKQLDDELVSLDAAVGGLGFQGLRRHVRRLSRAVHQGRPSAPLLHDLASALAVLEEMTGRDAGTRPLLDYVAQRGAGQMVEQCSRAAELLKTELLGRGGMAEALEAVEGSAERSDLLQMPRSASLLRLAADLMRRGGLADDARATLAGALDRVVAAVAANPPEDTGESEARRLDEMLRALIDRKGLEATIERALALGVDRDLLTPLSDEARERLAATLDDPNLVLLEIDADLDGDPELARRFAAWVADNADPVTSRVVALDGATRTRLLLATPARPAVIRTDLAALDRSGELLRVTICDGTVPALQHDAAHGHGDDTVRVPARLIDDILDQLGELMPVASGLEEMTRKAPLGNRRRELLRRAAEAGLDLVPLLDELDQDRTGLRQLGERLSRVLQGLRDTALGLRVVPVELLFNRYPRLVRDMARQQKKTIGLVVQANGARIDKGMVERLADPLMHMIRNAIDHGIEPAEEREAAGKPAKATLALRAIQRGEHVRIEVEDDGRGLDTERIRRRALEAGLIDESTAAAVGADAIHRFIFAPGFSTAEEVTQTSGRGVGMDVVATVAAELGGSVALRSEPGEGTLVTFELPLSAAIQSAIIVELGEQVFALPDRHVEAVVRGSPADTIELPGMPAAPVVDLADLLGLSAGSRVRDGEIVILSAAERRLGVRVERVLRRSDVVMKESHPAIAALPGLGGVSRLADGRIVLMLDPDGLIGLVRAGRADAA